MVLPPMGSGPAAAAGAMGGTILDPRPVNRPGVLGHTAQTASGQPAMQGGGYRLGQGNFADINQALFASANNPEIASHVLNVARGQKGRTTSILGEFMDNIYGRAIQAALAQAGLGPDGGNPNALLGVMEGVIGSLAGNGGAGFVPYMGGIAQQTLGTDMSGWKDKDVKTALSAANALQSLGLGDIAASGLDNELEELLYAMNEQALTDPAAKEGGVLAQLLQGSGYQRAMQRFAALR